MATKIFLGEPPAHIKQWIIDHYSKPKLTELCFTAEEANSSVKLQKQGSTAIEEFNGLEYKKVSATQLLAAGSDEWKPYTIDTFGQNNELSGLNVGDKVYMRAVPAGNSRMGTSSSNYHKFVMTGRIAASGNINTLLNPDPNADVSLEGKDRCYYHIFYRCSSLTQAPELPATTLASYCYQSMFTSCSSLTQAPELPATTLAKGCYYYMFSYCTSLTQAPELLATKLARNCYFYMFENCEQFSEVHMKQEMNGVYSTSTHGNTTKTVVYDLA